MMFSQEVLDKVIRVGGGIVMELPVTLATFEEFLVQLDCQIGAKKQKHFVH
jgi:hypothetical protein